MPAFDARLLVILAVSATATALLTIATLSGRLDRLDRRLFDALRVASADPNGAAPRRIVTALRDLAALGGDMLRGLLLAGFALAPALAGRGRIAIGLIAIYLAARLALVAIKRVLRRPRPDPGHARVATHTSSFPSGHTLMSTVLLLSAAALIPGATPFAATWIGLALLLALVIGIARMALGVHWPTDVLAGWLAGIAWTSGCLLLFDLATS